MRATSISTKAMHGETPFSSYHVETAYIKVAQLDSQEQEHVVLLSSHKTEWKIDFIWRISKSKREPKYYPREILFP